MIDNEQSYESIIAEIKAMAERAGTEGYNEYGVPLHACHGYRHDAHYWAWVVA
jgi:hypothetical protein